MQCIVQECVRMQTIVGPFLSSPFPSIECETPIHTWTLTSCPTNRWSNLMAIVLLAKVFSFHGKVKSTMLLQGPIQVMEEW